MAFSRSVDVVVIGGGPSGARPRGEREICGGGRWSGAHLARARRRTLLPPTPVGRKAACAPAARPPPPPREPLRAASAVASSRARPSLAAGSRWPSASLRCSSASSPPSSRSRRPSASSGCASAPGSASSSRRSSRSCSRSPAASRPTASSGRSGRRSRNARCFSLEPLADPRKMTEITTARRGLRWHQRERRGVRRSGSQIRIWGPRPIKPTPWEEGFASREPKNTPRRA